MQARFFLIIFISLLFSQLQSTPVKVSLLKNAKTGQRIFLFYDWHPRATGHKDAESIRKAWFNGCDFLLTEKDANYSVFIECMDFSIKKLKGLVYGKITKEKIRKMIRNNNNLRFIETIGFLGLDSRFTPAHVDLINVTSPVVTIMHNLAQKLRELETRVEENKSYLKIVENLFLDALVYPIESVGKILGLLERSDDSCLFYTFNQLTDELSLLKSRYESVQDCCEPNVQKFKSDCTELINELTKYINQINNFLKENKSKENVFQPIYEIYKEKLMRLGDHSKNNQEKLDLETLGKILFYKKKQDPEILPFPLFFFNGMDSQVIEKIFNDGTEKHWLIFMGLAHATNICDFLKESSFEEEVLGEGYFLAGEEKYSLQDLATGGFEVNAAIERSGMPLQVVPCPVEVLEKVKKYGQTE